MSEAIPAALAIDTHTHLNHPRLLRQLSGVLARAREAGVGEMIVVGYDLTSSERAVELVGQHEGLYAAVGVHPHEAGEVEEATLDRLRGLAGGEGVVAIGETGLDFYRDLSPRPAQVEAFRRHLALAEELERPVIIHCREAEETLLEVLSGEGQVRPGSVWHCFDGTAEQAARAVELGLMLGFSGVLTYRRAEGLREVAAGAPEDRVLVETDCPYLAPEPKRGRDNEPANVRLIVERLAEVRGVSTAEMISVTSANARRAFGLEERA